MKPARIAIFAKAPVPGMVKTRLIPALGEEGAAELARRMLEESWKAAKAVAVADAELCVDPEPASSLWLTHIPPDADLLSAQCRGDLGERLASAAERVIAGGQRVVLIGTDCPGLTTRRLTEACRELESHDAVIHPTFDGGYALLGLNRFDASIFSGIEWSTASVAAATLGRIRALGWSCHLGETLQDIDEPSDLEALSRRA